MTGGPGSELRVPRSCPPYGPLPMSCLRDSKIRLFPNPFRLRNRPEEFRYYTVQHMDSDNCRLLENLLLASTFIQEARIRGCKVLVHCQSGINRSAAMVIGYLMMEERLSYAEVQLCNACGRAGGSGSTCGTYIGHIRTPAPNMTRPTAATARSAGWASAQYGGSGFQLRGRGGGG